MANLVLNFKTLTRYKYLHLNIKAIKSICYDFFLYFTNLFLCELLIRVSEVSLILYKYYFESQNLNFWI